MSLAFICGICTHCGANQNSTTKRAEQWMQTACVTPASLKGAGRSCDCSSPVSKRKVSQVDTPQVKRSTWAMLGLTPGSSSRGSEGFPSASRLLGLGPSPSPHTGTPKRSPGFLLGLGPTPNADSGRKTVSGTSLPKDPLCPYACPCGWRPPATGDTGKAKKRIREIATKHWKQCQGCDAPAPTSEYMRAKKKAASAFALTCATKQATVCFRELCETLKSKKPRIANAMCKVDLSAPTRRDNNPTAFSTRACAVAEPSPSAPSR